MADALENKQAIVLENIEGIRRLYRKGNGQGAEYRRRTNGWSFAEAQRQIEYKARWVSLPIILLSKKRPEVLASLVFNAGRDSKRTNG